MSKFRNVISPWDFIQSTSSNLGTMILRYWGFMLWIFLRDRESLTESNTDVGVSTKRYKSKKRYLYRVRECHFRFFLHFQRLIILRVFNIFKICLVHHDHTHKHVSHRFVWYVHLFRIMQLHLKARGFYFSRKHYMSVDIHSLPE